MWTSEEIRHAVKGELQGKIFSASGVSIDSRAIKPGELFVAIKGERFDGHEYLNEVKGRGAAAALVHRIPENAPANLPLILCDNTDKALVDLGVAARNRTNAKIIGVTGSVGKTGTKEAIRLALSAAGETYATTGNLNNHIGVPLSLANLPPDAQYAVFEMGMNHAGEISYLTRLVRPHIAVITNIEAVHLEFFPSTQGIADAKSEIFEGLEPGGCAILPADSPHFNRLLENTRKLGVSEIHSFGSSADADYRLLSYSMHSTGSEIEASLQGQIHRFHLNAIGRHYAYTTLSAIAAAHAAGIDPIRAADALASFSEPKGRGRLQTLKLPQGEITLIDDSYNASPVSMKGAIAKLADFASALPQKPRTLAILGDMLELGPDSPDLHRSLLPALQSAHVDKVLAAGSLMKHLYESLPAGMQGGYTEDAASLATLALKKIQAGDIVLVKGSHGSKLYTLVEALEAAATSSSSCGLTAGSMNIEDGSCAFAQDDGRK